MDSEQSSDDEEPKPKQNAFQMMMQPPSKKAKVELDPIMIAVLYIRWLKWIDPLDLLFMCAYIGQAVRAGDTPEKVATARWKEENYQAVREDKDIGLIHCLDVYGPDAFDDVIFEWRRGPRSEVQDWANKREIELIAENGGPFRNPSVRCKQTLNQTKGGKWGCSFEARDALRTIAWLKFKAELEAYTACNETSLVPNVYVNTVSGYQLGQHLCGVRQGQLWKGHPDEADRVEWLQSLPKWAWDATKTDEYKEGNSERSKKQFESQESRDEISKRAKEWRENATPEQLAELSQKNLESHSTSEYKEAASERAKKQFESQEARDEQSKRAKKQFESQEARDEASTRAKTQAEREAADGMKSLAERGKGTRTANWTKEQREAAVAKRKVTTAAKRAKIAAGELEDTNAIKRALIKTANRAKVLEGLPEAQRKTKEKEYAVVDLKEANRKGKANVLLQLPEYSDKGYQWCYKNLTPAQKDGVVFVQDANGVWSARVRDQGSSGQAGSSADHAALTETEEAPMEEEELL